MKQRVKPPAKGSRVGINSASAAADLRIQTVQQLMRENLHRDLSLGELANAVNLSIWRLCRIFKSETGMSPMQYLKALRLEKARHLLETSFLSIGQITSQVGSFDQSHFGRDFKKAYGASPSMYRMRFQGVLLKESVTANFANKQQERPSNHVPRL